MPMVFPVLTGASSRSGVYLGASMYGRLGVEANTRKN